MTTTRRPIEVEDLYAIKGVADAQISPDATRVAYVLTEIDRDADDYRTSIWVVDLTDGAASARRRFTHGPKKDSAPRWSPDGTRLAFLSDRDGDQPQLYVMPATGGEGHRLTALEKGAAPAVWSPDSRHIAFAARWHAEEPPKDKDARKRWDQRPKVITRASYKTDGQGYTLDVPSRVFVVPADLEEPDKDLRPLIEPDGTAEDRTPAWSPDGRSLAFARTRAAISDYNLSDLWIVDRESGNARRLTETIGRATAPSWSPDGHTIAVFGTDAQEPGLGEHTIRVWLVPTDATNPRNLTKEFDRAAYLPAPPAAPAGPIWSPDGHTLTYTLSNEGCLHVAHASTSDGSVNPVIAGERWITNVSSSADGQHLAFVAHSPDQPGDVYLTDSSGKNERKLTDVNRDWLNSIDLPRVERRKFISPHGYEIDGWLFQPLGATGPAPLLINIHGGPHSFAGSKFEATAFYCYVLAARGWAALALNPTGSGSYGQQFAHNIRQRWGEHDLPEQLAAIDALVKEGIADPARLAVTGYSYGGYMTSWTVGHTDRFKAAVVGAPVTNFESFHGNSDIGMKWLTDRGNWLALVQ